MSAEVVTLRLPAQRRRSPQSSSANLDAAALSDMVVVNTCAVTAEAVSQARQTIRKKGLARAAIPPLIVSLAAPRKLTPASFRRYAGGRARDR